MSTRTTIRLVGATALAAMTLAVAGCAGDPPSAVVGLTVSGCPPGQAHGSGIVVEPGLVLTSAHVVKGADEIVLTNGEQSSQGTVVAFDPDMDLAYIAVDPGFGIPVALSEGGVERGARGTAYVFRDGLAEEVPVRVRRPVEIHTEDIYIEGDTSRRGFELDAEIQAGDSGGPVIVDGKVIGVIWARSSKHEGRAYAIDPLASGETVREQLRTGVIDDTIDLDRCT